MKHVATSNLEAQLFGLSTLVAAWQARTPRATARNCFVMVNETNALVPYAGGVWLAREAKGRGDVVTIFRQCGRWSAMRRSHTGSIARSPGSIPARPTCAAGGRCRFCPARSARSGPSGCRIRAVGCRWRSTPSCTRALCWRANTVERWRAPHRQRTRRQFRARLGRLSLGGRRRSLHGPAVGRTEIRQSRHRGGVIGAMFLPISLSALAPAKWCIPATIVRARLNGSRSFRRRTECAGQGGQTLLELDHARSRTSSRSPARRWRWRRRIPPGGAGKPCSTTRAGPS